MSHTTDVDEECRELVRSLGEAGWLKYAIGGTAYGAATDTIDTRALCLIRETLARHSGLADFAFAMQGLGSGAISLFGTHDAESSAICRASRMARPSRHSRSPEPDAGSDVAALQCGASATATPMCSNGEKTWISNGGIADFYVVFARTGEGAGRQGYHRLHRRCRDARASMIAERIEVIAPHPLARLALQQLPDPRPQRIGEAGQGFKVAMATLDVFRTSVAAAALGFARRALR